MPGFTRPYFSNVWDRVERSDFESISALISLSKHAPNDIDPPKVFLIRHGEPSMQSSISLQEDHWETSSSLFCPRSLVAPVISLGLRGATGSKDTTGVQPRKQNAGRLTCENHWFHSVSMFLSVNYNHSFGRTAMWRSDLVRLDTKARLFKGVRTLPCQPASRSCSAVLVLSWSHSSCWERERQFYTSLALTLCWTVWSNLDSRIATKVIEEGCRAGTSWEGIKPPTLRDQGQTECLSSGVDWTDVEFHVVYIYNSFYS